MIAYTVIILSIYCVMVHDGPNRVCSTKTQYAPQFQFQISETFIIFGFDVEFGGARCRGAVPYRIYSVSTLRRAELKSIRVQLSIHQLIDFAKVTCPMSRLFPANAKLTAASQITRFLLPVVIRHIDHNENF